MIFLAVPVVLKNQLHYIICYHNSAFLHIYHLILQPWRQNDIDVDIVNTSVSFPCVCLCSMVLHHLDFHVQ